MSIYLCNLSNYVVLISINYYYFSFLLLVHIGIVFNISELLLFSVHVNNRNGLHYYCAKFAFLYCIHIF